MDKDKLLKEIYKKISEYKNIDHGNQKDPSTNLEAFELGHECGYICLSQVIDKIFKKHNYQPTIMDKFIDKSSTRTFLTVSQLAKKHTALREGGIRHWIFHAKENGFESCLRRIGKKILIDEELFFGWLDNQNDKNKLN